MIYSVIIGYIVVVASENFSQIILRNTADLT